MGFCTGQEVEWDQGFLRPHSILIFLCCSKVSKTQVAVVLPFTSHFASFFAVTQLFHLVYQNFSPILSYLFTSLGQKKRLYSDHMAT